MPAAEDCMSACGSRGRCARRWRLAAEYIERQCWLSEAGVDSGQWTRAECGTVCRPHRGRAAFRPAFRIRLAFFPSRSFPAT